jgi:hypothetical protein
MIRRPLWNRGGGVFVEEASWNVPVERRPAADQPAGTAAVVEVQIASPADRPPAPAGRAKAETVAARPRQRPVARREPAGPRRPTWLGVLTVREDD